MVTGKINTAASATVLLLFLLFLSSCSRRVMEAMETHKLHDVCFILRKNGHYSIKVLVMGAWRMPDSERGRYARSGDTIYLIIKRDKNVFETTEYAVIDSFSNTLTYYSKSAEKARVFQIGKMAIRSNDKSTKQDKPQDGNERKF